MTFSSVEESINNEFPWCIYFDQDQGIWNGTEWIRREGSYVGSGLTAHEVNGYIHKFCHTQDDRQGSTDQNRFKDRTNLRNPGPTRTSTGEI